MSLFMLSNSWHYTAVGGNLSLDILLHQLFNRTVMICALLSLFCLGVSLSHLIKVHKLIGGNYPTVYLTCIFEKHYCFTCVTYISLFTYKNDGIKVTS